MVSNLNNYIQGIERTLTLRDGILMGFGKTGGWSFPVDRLRPCEGDSLADGVFTFQDGVRFIVSCPKNGEIFLDCREAHPIHIPAPPPVQWEHNPEYFPIQEYRRRPNHWGFNSGVRLRPMSYQKL